MTLLHKVSITSDKKYLKILKDAEITISANGTPDADSTFPADPQAPGGFTGIATIDHDLGTIPLVRAFWDPAKNGTWYSAYQIIGGTSLDPWLKYIATTTQLKLIMNTNGAAKTNIPVFYRIYDVNERSVDSDSRIDKIFLKDVTSVTLSGGSSGAPATAIVPIPHNANEAVLWGVEFSEDGDNWLMEGLQNVGPFDTATGPPGGPYGAYFYTAANAYADNNTLYILVESTYAASKTIYLRYTVDYRK